MKIGFDAKRAFLNRTGLGNYSRWLINALVKYYPENEYLLYTPKVKPGIYTPPQSTQTKSPKLKFFTSRWRTSGILYDLRRDGIELYHGLSHELPIGIERWGIRSVVTVHDLIFMRFPQYFSWINRYIYKAKLVVACRAADKIIAISQKTKDDLVELLNVDPSKIVIIYQSCDASFKTEQTAEQKQTVKAKYNLPDKYLLNVGTIEPRKNLLLLVKALGQVANIKLVVVGKPTAYLDEVKAYINQHELTDRVIFLHGVKFDELPAIYQQAGCFIYPSRYEGFGIPILEALCSGAAAIGATGSCLEEAGGPDSLYTDPDNEFQLAGLIMQVLSDENLRQNMITKGLAYSRNFADDKLAAQHAELYKNVLNHA
ncbi:glycosyltransferase family 4 protein [Mucilaginibacter jinjuensis]|uniref:Glycosyltransferase family 1 protein n=1 Tax=Mucilaginibacter jinjuensis TaxID=1176721 RepID=A0ABY7TC03_9SPHI|nr:glycosyltransferase family 1 protein [Mucilaginibacter jinjuensis]WCT13856.1 glycosyltransferase family 1 protein [Mucilaginibacter jinjuensis]